MGIVLQDFHHGQGTTEDTHAEADTQLITHTHAHTTHTHTQEEEGVVVNTLSGQQAEEEEEEEEEESTEPGPQLTQGAQAETLEKVNQVCCTH
jgi:hypothetical protein